MTSSSGKEYSRPLTSFGLRTEQPFKVLSLLGESQRGTRKCPNGYRQSKTAAARAVPEPKTQSWEKFGKTTKKDHW